MKQNLTIRRQRSLGGLHHGCQIFIAACGQNPDKKWPKWLFFEKLWPKSQNVLTMIISS